MEKNLRLILYEWELSLCEEESSIVFLEGLPDGIQNSENLSLGDDMVGGHIEDISSSDSSFCLLNFSDFLHEGREELHDGFEIGSCLFPETVLLELEIKILQGTEYLETELLKLALDPIVSEWCKEFSEHA